MKQEKAKTIYGEVGSVMKPKKVEQECLTNDIGMKFDIASFKEHLRTYESWVLGHHLMQHAHNNIIDQCIRDLQTAMDGKIPVYLVDGCAWIEQSTENIKTWIEHQWELKQTVDHIWESIRRDDAEALSRCNLKKQKKKHWWNK